MSSMFDIVARSREGVVQKKRKIPSPGHSSSCTAYKRVATGSNTSTVRKNAIAADSDDDDDLIIPSTFRADGTFQKLVLPEYGFSEDEDENDADSASSTPVEWSAGQKRAIELFRSRKSFCLTGQAGSGKSRVIKHIVQNVAAELDLIVRVTASTGISAVQIQGTTLHSFSGIGLGKESVGKLANKVLNNSNTVRRWRQADALVIDEISMISNDLFDKIESIARIARESNAPFGGLQVVACGDFLQLPPVTSRWEARERGAGDTALTFTAKSWNSVFGGNTVVLEKVFRQKHGEDLHRLLSEVRVAKLSQWAKDLLARKTLETTRLPMGAPGADGIRYTMVSSLNRDVSRLNDRELKKLRGPRYVFTAQCRTAPGAPRNPAMIKNLKRMASKNCLAPDCLELAVGAQVMLVYNLDTDAGLMNGSRGSVVGFERFDRHGYEKLRKSTSWGQKFCEFGVLQCVSRTVRFPVVAFRGGVRRTIAPIAFKFGGSMHKPYFIKAQVPIALAWCVTIHKCQGMTLDYAEVDLGEVFQEGQAYVALSRARSLDGLRVRNYRPGKIRANAYAQNFYEQQQQRGEEEGAGGGGGAVVDLTTEEEEEQSHNNNNNKEQEEEAQPEQEIHILEN